jgi:hypothetical protein
MGVAAVVEVIGNVPEWANFGSGYGSGSGYGYGYGDGSGYGYGSGSGSGSGYGYGYGYGDGSGYGYGYGDGSGSGYGDGSGSGDGSGDGYGYGYGDGSGYGGYGDGSGDGDGDGYGYGYGSKEYWLSAIKYFSAKWTSSQQKRLSECEFEGLTIAYWRSTSTGNPANGGSDIKAAAPGIIHRSDGPLELCRSGTLHATFIPPKWKGERWWVVAMHGEIASDCSDKIGALKREILGECL